jgi:hypothetical protein
VSGATTREGFICWSEMASAWRCAWDDTRSSSQQRELDGWREPLSVLRIPKLFDLRADPFERGDPQFAGGIANGFPVKLNVSECWIVNQGGRETRYLPVRFGI